MHQESNSQRVRTPNDTIHASEYRRLFRRRQVRDQKQHQRSSAWLAL
jgi:hypothetical protein